MNGSRISARKHTRPPDYAVLPSLLLPCPELNPDEQRLKHTRKLMRESIINQKNDPMSEFSTVNNELVGMGHHVGNVGLGRMVG